MSTVKRHSSGLPGLRIEMVKTGVKKNKLEASSCFVFSSWRRLFVFIPKQLSTHKRTINVKGLRCGLCLSNST